MTGTLIFFTQAQPHLLNDGDTITVALSNTQPDITAITLDELTDVHSLGGGIEVRAITSDDESIVYRLVFNTDYRIDVDQELTARYIILSAGNLLGYFDKGYSQTYYPGKDVIMLGVANATIYNFYNTFVRL